jgi:outer membrane murein-binding lipoprotein Lpp
MITRFAATTLSLLLAGCMSQTEVASIEAAAAQFHDLQAAGDDNGIYQAASPQFRAGARLEDITRLNNAVRGVRGCNAPARDPAQFNNSLNTSGHFITVVYNRQCTDGPLTETFTFIVNGQTAKLFNYNVAGMALFPATPPAAAPAPTDTATPAPPSSTQPAPAKPT